MGKRNLSIDQFKDLMARIPKEVAAELERVPFEQGEILAAVMRRAAPQGMDGVHELQQSIRVEKGRRPLQVLVKAGGPLTTRLGKQTGRPDDYAINNEFGTHKMSAQPFFWPSYRLMKKSIRAAMNKKAKAAISKVVPLK